MPKYKAAISMPLDVVRVKLQVHATSYQAAASRVAVGAAPPSRMTKTRTTLRMCRRRKSRRTRTRTKRIMMSRPRSGAACGKASLNNSVNLPRSGCTVLLALHSESHALQGNMPSAMHVLLS